MTVFWVLLGIAVLGGVAVVAAGRGDGLADTERDRADLTMPQDRPARREDVDRVRFSVGLRGYRMDEVDDVLDRLALDIAMRDGQISELLGELAERSGHDESLLHPEPGPAQTGAPIEGAALVAEVDVPVDPATSRTLVVPLEQYEPSSADQPGAEQPGAEQPGAEQPGAQQPGADGAWGQDRPGG